MELIAPSNQVSFGIMSAGFLFILSLICLIYLAYYTTSLLALTLFIIFTQQLDLSHQFSFHSHVIADQNDNKDYKRHVIKQNAHVNTTITYTDMLMLVFHGISIKLKASITVQQILQSRFLCCKAWEHIMSVDFNKCQNILCETLESVKNEVLLLHLRLRPKRSAYEMSRCLIMLCFPHLAACFPSICVRRTGRTL